MYHCQLVTCLLPSGTVTGWGAPAPAPSWAPPSTEGRDTPTGRAPPPRTRGTTTWRPRWPSQADHTPHTTCITTQGDWQIFLYPNILVKLCISEAIHPCYFTLGESGLNKTILHLHILPWLVCLVLFIHINLHIKVEFCSDDNSMNSNRYFTLHHFVFRSR